MNRPRVVIVAGATAAGAALRAVTLTRTTIDNDEAYTVALTQHGFGEMWRLFRFEANGLLYPLVSWPVLQVTHAAAWLRLPALLAGIATIPVVYLLGRELAGPRLGAWAAFVAAANPFAVTVSQYGRGYSFALFLSACSYLALLHGLRGSRRAWALYAVSTALAGYAQLLALVLIPLGQLVPVAAAGRARARAWLTALVGAVALAAPLLVLAVVENGRRDPLYWLLRPGLGALLQGALYFVGGRLEFAPDLTFRWAWLPVVGLALWAVVIAAAVVRSRHERRRLDDPLLALLWWTLAPALALMAVSQLRPLFEVDRSLVSCVPGACLLVALAALRLSAPARTAAATAVVAVSVAASVWGTTSPPGPDNTGVGRWLATHRPASVPVVIEPLQWLAPLGYYVPSLRAADGTIDIPEWRLAALPAGVSGYETAGSYSPGPLGPPPFAALRRAALSTPSRRVILVLDTEPGDEGDLRTAPGVRRLRRDCVTRERDFAGVAVLDASACR